MSYHPNPKPLKKMATRSTRNKIKFQVDGAFNNLYEAQKHLTNIASLADERSDYIDKFLPPIMVSLETMLDVMDRFREGI